MLLRIFVLSVVLMCGYAFRGASWRTSSKLEVPTQFRLFNAPGDVKTKSEALAKVKKAAEAFTQKESRDSAMKIVAQLEQTDSAHWGKQLELIDACLIDEQPEACDAFEAAMFELRSLHEAAAGNG